MEDLPQADLWAEIVRLRGENAQLRATSIDMPPQWSPIIEAVATVVVFHANQAAAKSLQLNFVSDGCREILGINPDSVLAQPEQLWDLVIPSDRERVQASLADLGENANRWSCQFGIITPSGQEKWIEGTARADRDTDTNQIQWRGVLVDATSRKVTESALREANEELHRLINSVPGFLWSAELTEQGEFLFRYFSRGCISVLGRPPEYFLEQTPAGWLSLIHSDDLPSLDAALHRVLSRTSTGEEHDYRVRWPDGSYRWVHDQVSVVRSEDGRYLLYGAISDVNSQHLADEVIQNSLDELERRVEERTSELELSWAAQEQQSQVLESVLQCMADGVLVANAQGHFIHFNPAAERIIGFGAVVDDASSWARHYGLFLPDQSELYAAEDLPLARARRGETVQEAEIYVCNDQHPDGVTISVNASPLYSRTGELQGGVAVLRDITDQKRYEERLLAEEALLRKLLELQEQDRKLVSYELHDGLLQYVIGAKLIVEALCHSSTGKQRETAEAVRHLLGSAIEEGRAMISGLRPMIIDEQGIVGAINYLISDQPNQDIDIRFTHSVNFDRIDPRFEQTVYRIVQEALTNVRRHSGAKAATVDIRQQQSNLLIEVRDSGSGFVPADVPSDRFGVRGIQERARLFGGAARIISAPGEGTTISVTIPLPQPGHT